MSGLQQLLNKLGLPNRPGQAQVGRMKPEGAGSTGEAWGPEGQLLLGLGYSEADVASTLRNRSELAHLRDFLRGAAPTEVPSKLDEGVAGSKGDGDGLAAEPGDGEAREPGLRREGPSDPQGPREAREEGPVDRGQALEEPKESPDAADPHRSRAEEDPDDEDKPGAGWWAEEMEDDEDSRKPGGSADAFAHEHRCRARLPDGNRCLHRPVEGQPYCAVHRAGG